MMRALFLALALAGLASAPALAEPQQFAWQGLLLFEPEIPVPGGTLGTLLAEISGRDDMAGQMPISGTVTYDRAADATAINSNVPGYRGAVTEMHLQFGLVPLSAEIARVEEHAETSHIGVLAFENGAFCSDTEHCEVLGVVGPSWGNMMLLHNSTGHFFVDETGMSHQMGDLFGTAMGRTDTWAEFFPQIQTQDHGLVAVDGLYIALFSEPGREFFSDHSELPMIEIFQDWSMVGEPRCSSFWSFGP